MTMGQNVLVEVSNFILEDGGRLISSDEAEVGSRYGKETITVNYLQWRGRFVKIYENIEDGLVFHLSEATDQFDRNLTWTSIFKFTCPVDPSNMDDLLKWLAEVPKDKNKYLDFLKSHIEKLKALL